MEWILDPGTDHRAVHLQGDCKHVVMGNCLTVYEAELYCPYETKDRQRIHVNGDDDDDDVCIYAVWLAQE